MKKRKIEKSDFINEINLNNRNCFKNMNINNKDINNNNNNNNPINISNKFLPNNSFQINQINDNISNYNLNLN